MYSRPQTERVVKTIVVSKTVKGGFQHLRSEFEALVPRHEVIDIFKKICYNICKDRISKKILKSLHAENNNCLVLAGKTPAAYQNIA